MPQRPATEPSTGPSVDVVIPCYRYGDVLPVAVRSVLDQTGVDVRVLVIDDASGDGSVDVARALAREDARVEVREHPENRGHIATFNEGVLGWASASYTVLMSADDALTPGALARATALLEADPRVGLVYGSPVVWDGSEPLPPARQGPGGATVYSGHDWLRKRFARGDNCIWSPEVVVRTAVQQRVGGYRGELLHTSDLEMWMRFALLSDVGFLTGVDQAYYRAHGENMSSSYKSDGGLRDLRMRGAAFASVLEHADGILPDVPALDRRVRRELARAALGAASAARERGAADAAAALVEFAVDTAPHLQAMPEWHLYRLRLRRRTAPVPTGRRTAGALARGVRRRLRDHRRRTAGV